jgi:recombinational DNA repair protein RecR
LLATFQSCSQVCEAKYRGEIKKICGRIFETKKSVIAAARTIELSAVYFLRKKEIVARTGIRTQWSDWNVSWGVNAVSLLM